MAVVALTAIIESRTAVEREGRRAAEEVARQYGKELERPWGNLLIQQDRYSQRWCDWLSEVVGGWPGTERRAQIEREGARFPELDPAAELEEWQAQYPGLRSEEVFPDSFGLRPDGRFQGGLEFNPAPQPPPWFLALSPAQRAAWDALKGAAMAGATAEEIDQRIAQFQETSPEPEAEVNALFIGLRAHLAMARGKQAVVEALQFARENPEALSEAGLPLANLAYGEALRYGRTAEALQPLWEAIPGQVLRTPSPLVPELLDQLEELAGTNPALHAGVGAWRTLWNARLKLHDVAEAVRQSGKLHGLTTANVWIEHDEGRWLCLLNPAHSRLSQSAERGTVDSTNELWTEVRFVPKAVAEQSLVRALENSEVKLPGYLGLAAWLEGEPLTLPARWSPGRDTNAAPAFLAEANGALSSPGKFRKAHGRAGGGLGKPAQPPALRPAALHGGPGTAVLFVSAPRADAGGIGSGIRLRRPDRRLGFLAGIPAPTAPERAEEQLCLQRLSRAAGAPGFGAPHGGKPGAGQGLRRPQAARVLPLHRPGMPPALGPDRERPGLLPHRAGPQAV